MIVAGIDIGTNTVRLLIADLRKHVKKATGIKDRTRDRCSWTGAVAILIYPFLFLCVLPSVSEAIPAFARKYDLSCGSCHTKPPRLNAFGEMFHMSGFQIPMVPEGEIKGKRRIGRIISETDFLNIFSARTSGDFVQGLSGGDKGEANIAYPQSLEIYLAGIVTDGISYFFELEHSARAIEGIEGGLYRQGPEFGVGKEFFLMFDLSQMFSAAMAPGADGAGHAAHGAGGRRVMGPMVMVGKIDPSTNFSYPTNRQLILNLPGRVDSGSGAIERFGLTPYAFAAKFFGIRTADGQSVEPTRPVLYNSTGDLGMDFHIMVGPWMIQTGLMQGLGAGSADANPKKDPYLMARVNFGGTDYFSGSLSGLAYRGNDTAGVPVPPSSSSADTELIDWRRYGLAANLKYKLLDLYGALIWDRIEGLPDGIRDEFDPKAAGLTVQGDYLASDRALISLRYDQLNGGGLAGERSDGKVLTAQMRYYLRENVSFYLRDSYNLETVNDEPLRNFRNLIAFGVDLDF